MFSCEPHFVKNEKLVENKKYWKKVLSVEKHLLDCALSELQVEEMILKINTPEDVKGNLLKTFREHRTIVRKIWRKLLYGEGIDFSDVNTYLIWIDDRSIHFRTMNLYARCATKVWQKKANFATVKIFNLRRLASLSFIDRVKTSLFGKQKNKRF